MTGIEILTSEQVVTEFATNWWLAGIVWLAVAIFGGVIGWLSVPYDKIEFTIGGFCIGTLFGILVFIAVAISTETPIVYETHYKVTISDEVSMNDFYEHYEVIDQDGKIFTVKEKTND